MYDQQHSTDNFLLLISSQSKTILESWGSNFWMVHLLAIINYRDCSHTAFAGLKMAILGSFRRILTLSRGPTPSYIDHYLSRFVLISEGSEIRGKWAEIRRWADQNNAWSRSTASAQLSTDANYRHTDKHLRLVMTLIAVCCRPTYAVYLQYRLLIYCWNTADCSVHCAYTVYTL